MLTVRFDELGLQPGMRVLDLGCGEGRHVAGLQRIPGLQTFGLDLGEDEVTSTASKLEEMYSIPPEAGGAAAEHGTWSLVRGSGYDLPFADESLDCVIFSEVLEHLHEDDRALDEVHRILKPGGRLALSVPREGPESICWLLSKEYRNTPGGHVRIYRRKALRAKLEARGYKIQNTHFAHALHSPYWWLRCLIGPSNDTAWPIRMYHNILVWDLMSRPTLTRVLERLLNPFFGKSVVFYATRA